MTNWTPNLITKIVTTLAVLPISLGTPPAEAGACYPSLAADTMNTALAGGASLKEAWRWAMDDGYSDGSQRCWTMVKGYTRTVHLVKPYLWNAITR